MSPRKKEPHIFVIIAIGANLPAADGASALQTCDRAARALGALPGLSACVRSRWFSSAPVPASDQPRYINGALRAACTLAPAELLAALQAIERAHGRVRGEANAARPLDLDVIDMDGLIRAAPDPILPHPRAHLRAFVLYPLRDVAPSWVHPVTRESVHALIAGLPAQDIRPA